MTNEEMVKKIEFLENERKNRRYRDWRRKVRTYQDMNEIAQKGQIVMVGSSLMEFFPINEYCMSLGVDKVVYNRGISGTVTDECLAELDALIFDLEPSKVFINIGTNDINERSDGEYWQDHLLKNYEEILRQIKERLPETKVYVMAYYPVNPEVAASIGISFTTRTNAALNDTNDKLKKLAEKYGYSYIDVNDGIKDEKGQLKAEVTVEGMHLHAGGYKPVFEELRKYF